MSIKPQNEDAIERTGTVIEILGSARFRVEVEKDQNLTTKNDPLLGQRIVCALRGKMRQKRIRIVRGDRVKLEIIIIGNSMDSITGKIVFRLDKLDGQNKIDGPINPEGDGPTITR